MNERALDTSESLSVSQNAPFDQLQAASLHPDDSLRMIEQVVSTLTERSIKRRRAG
jgi:hypothetical protein